MYHPQLTDFQKQCHVESFLTTDGIPDTFQVLSVAECRGVQSFPRAELQAIITLAHTQIPMDVYTDSRYSIDTWNTLQHTIHLHVFHKCPNFDLMLELHPLIPTSGMRLRKVKSHELPKRKGEAAYQSSWWLELGNEAADSSAKDALKHYEAVTPMHDTFDDHVQEMHRLTQQYQYFADLQCARARLIQTADSTEPPEVRIRSWTTQIQLLQNWMPSEVWKFKFDAEDTPKLDHFIWGAQYSFELLHFLEQLVWPVHEQDPLKAGVTWYELMISFKWYMQKGITANAGTSGMGFRPHRLEINNEDVSTGKQTLYFERSLSTLKLLLGKTFWQGERITATSVRTPLGSHSG